MQYNSDSSIQPFLATNYTSNPQWSVEGEHYSCGSMFMIEYGAEPTPSQLMFMGVGISSLDPTGSTPPPNDVAEDAVDLFFDRPSDFYDSGTDSSGLPTVCALCVTKGVSSIAQKGGDDPVDLSCFGGCQGYGDESIHWGPVAMGEFTSCTDNPQTFVGCQMTIATNNSWYGGTQDYDAGNGTAVSYSPGATSSFAGFYLVDPRTPQPTPTRTPPTLQCTKPPCPQVLGTPLH
ncbi:MAG TPA: hypothetical protein VMF11_04560 [Candidatus Baltobacteraceae bacterium]|nr:hypothetical protein [Candidatus Baltobacteraceae bacterium]